MRIKLISCALALVFATAGVVSVTAQQGGDAPISQFLEITPVRVETPVDKGQSVTREVTVTNKHVAPIRLKTSFLNMVAEGEDGETRGTDDPTPWDLKRYATVNGDEFTLAARESRKVSFTLTMPPDVAPGGYYGMIRFTPTNRTDLPPVAVQGTISTIVLVRVPGPATEKGDISEFYAASASGTKLGPLFIGNDVTFVTKVKNDGNVHFSANPSLEVTNQFGDKSFAPQPVEPRNVFPTATRKFEYRWEKAGSGWFTATTKASLPNNQNAQKQLKILVITPLVAGIVGGVVLLLIIGLVVLSLRRKRRRARANKG